MKRNLHLILLILSLAGLLTLLIFFRSFFVENILRPIGLIVWLGWRVVTSVNQSFYWAAVILLSAFLVLRMLPRDSLAGQDGQAGVPNTDKIPNPYLDWLSAFRHSAANPSALESLRHRLRELTASFINSTDRTPIREVEAALQAKRSRISKESRSFLFSEKEVPRGFTGKLSLRAAFFLAALRRGKTSKMPKIIHEPVDEILSFMEEKAKTTHEH